MHALEPIPLLLVVAERLHDLLLRRHDERPVLHDGLVEGLSRDEHEADVVARGFEPDARRAGLVREDCGVELREGGLEARAGRGGRGGADEGLPLERVDL